jgi:hypothetical protein
LLPVLCRILRFPASICSGGSAPGTRPRAFAATAIPLFVRSARFPPVCHRPCYSRETETEDHDPDEDVSAVLVGLTKVGEAAEHAAQHDVEVAD